MPLDLTSDRPRGAGRGLSSAWKVGLIRLGLAWLGLFATFATDWARLFDQWWNSSTYNHMLLVPVMVAWLIAQRHEAVLQLNPVTWLPGIGGALLALLVWVLGAVSGLDLLRQTGAVALLPASVAIVLGPRVFAGLLFPLFFMAFMIPFGDEFVPPLQMITAALTIGLVRMSNIPAAIDGVFIDTPAGLFEVAEACSGVKFLIAMIALGVFVAHIGFRSWHRRAAFLALCVVAPILANGVRAFGTIWAAQYVGAERAGGIDHLIYGWVFFAIVIALVLGLAWRWFDRPADSPMLDIETIEHSALLGRLEAIGSGKPNVVGAAFVCTVLAALLWVRTSDGRIAELPAQIALPQVNGWSRIDYVPIYPWEPRASGADHRLLGRYQDSQGRQVDVFVALYGEQREGKEAGGFGEGALRADAGWSWMGAGDGVPNARVERLRSERGSERVAETYYRTGDLLTGSNARLKLATIRDRLLLRAQPTSLLILSSEARAGHVPAEQLAAFRSATGPLDAWIDRVGSGR